MHRVLLILPADADFETSRSATMLRAIVSRTISIGRGGTHASTIDAIRHLRAAQRNGDVQSDLVHAYGTRALIVAAAATRQAIAFNSVGHLSINDLRLLRAVMRMRTVHVVCSTSWQRHQLQRSGIEQQHLHLIRPAVDMATLPVGRDHAVRARLGIADDDRIILAPGEATAEAHLPLSLFAATVLNVMDRRNRMLVWGRGPKAQALRRFAYRLQQPTLIDASQHLGANVEFESLLGAADEVLVSARSPASTLPIAMCLAAGLPIVAVADRSSRELLAHGQNAVLVNRPSARVLAERILELRDDPTLRSSISERGKADAAEIFSPSRFLDEHGELYRRVVTQANALRPKSLNVAAV